MYIICSACIFYFTHQSYTMGWAIAHRGIYRNVVVDYGNFSNVVAENIIKTRCSQIKYQCVSLETHFNDYHLKPILMIYT